MEIEKRPKPTAADYEKRAELNNLYSSGMISDEKDSEYLDMMNSFD